MAVIVGVRNKFVDGENPGNYWHLVNLGTRPHGQPNLRVVLISRVGRNKSSGQFERQSGFVTLAREGEVFRHPGARARNIRNRAFMRARNEVPPKMAKKFKEAHEREVRRQ